MIHLPIKKKHTIFPIAPLLAIIVSYFRQLMLLFFLLLFSSHFVLAQAPFITTWVTNNPGTSDSTSITIPTAFGLFYDYEVDWNNDGIFDESNIHGDVTHDFLVADTVTIRIRGTFPRIYFKNQGDCKKIINIDQWGDIQWSSMESAFMGASNLKSTANDTPDLSNVSNCYAMFHSATAFDGDLSTWDVSTIVNMNAMFHGAASFNSDLSNWNVSNATNMSFMFGYATSFNSNIGSWDVSHVTDMSYMFHGAAVFNGDISNWDVSQVTDMRSLFFGNTQFNQDISGWDVGKVTYMKSMFYGATMFNQDISNWDVSQVVNTALMFNQATAFNQDLSQWNVSSLKDMGWMFSEAVNFNADLSQWNVSNVHIMQNAFFKASTFNADISNWDVGQVTNMKNMFYEATSFNQNLGNWDITNVTAMDYMLYNTNMSTLNYDNLLIGWAAQNVSHNIDLGIINLKYCNGKTARNTLINNYGWIFLGDQLECQNSQAFITTWKTDKLGASNATSITIPTFPGESYFYNVDWNNDGVYDTLGVTGEITHDFSTPGTYTIRISGTFPRIYFNNSGDKDKLLTINQWGSYPWSSFNRAFYGCSNLASAYGTINLEDAKDLSIMFSGATIFNADLNDWDVKNVTNLSNLFSHTNSFDSDLSNWDVGNVTDMSFLFASATAFTGKNIGNWNIEKVTNLSGMFQGATSFNTDLSSWKPSSSKNTSFMFSGATSFNSNLNNWAVDSVTNMSAMFQGASSFNSNLNNWNVSHVTNMSYLFSGATSFDGDIMNWSTHSVTNMKNMFGQAKVFNRNIGGWDVSNVSNMNEMFMGATLFDQALGNWNIKNLLSADNMFKGVTLSTTNYDSLICGWASNPNGLQPNVHFSAGNSQYCTCSNQRASLIANDNWTISDGGLKTGCPTSSSNLSPLQANITPNPTDGILNIDLTTYHKTSITVLDMVGKKLLQKEIIDNHTQLNLDNLPNGIYYLLLTTNNHQLYQKIVVTK